MKNTGFVLAVALAAWFAATPGFGADVDDQLPTPPDGKAWKLVWNDEFDGTKLDESKWEVPENRRRDGFWSRKAISLDGKGNLVISALKDGDKFLDGCVRTRGKFEHAFGYYVARTKFQKEQGHWTAFWMYAPSVGKIGDEGRDGTEIDIMEKPSLDDQMNHALHWDGYGKEHRSEAHKFKVPGIMEGYHDFALWWTPDEYVFYVDGKETWRTKAGGVCQVPLYLKLSDEIGDWAGDIKKAKLPDEFLVDYVRVYDLVEK
jgi:beta-glucanase (GH16 family)